MVWFLRDRVFLSPRIDPHTSILVNLHLLWRSGVVATLLGGLAASLTHLDSMLRTANKEAALIHSWKIAKDAKPFTLWHVREGKGMFHVIKAALVSVPNTRRGIRLNL